MQTTVFQTATTAESEIVPVIGPEDMEESVTTVFRYHRKNEAMWSFNDAQFTAIIKESINWQEVALKCGYALRKDVTPNKHGKYETCLRSEIRIRIIKRVDMLHISHAHIKNKFRTKFADLKSKRRYRASTLRRMLEKSGRIYTCAVCKCENMTPEHGKWLWRDWPLLLQVDHINGIDGNDADRIDNLQLLCGNCHSQSSNFCGRALRKNRVVPESVTDATVTTIDSESAAVVVADTNPEGAAVVTTGSAIKRVPNRCESWRSSKIQISICDEQFSKLVKESTNLTDLGEKCGYKLHQQKVGKPALFTHQRYQIINRIDEMQIPHTHFIPRSNGAVLKQIEDLAHKRRHVSQLRTLLHNSGRFYMCEWCRCEAMTLENGEWYWMGKILTLQVDHIHGVDGTNQQDRLDNLRWLCSSCHTQSANYGKRKTKA